MVRCHSWKTNKNSTQSVSIKPIIIFANQIKKTKKDEQNDDKAKADITTKNTYVIGMLVRKEGRKEGKIFTCLIARRLLFWQNSESLLILMT